MKLEDRLLGPEGVLNAKSAWRAVLASVDTSEVSSAVAASSGRTRGNGLARAGDEPRPVGLADPHQYTRRAQTDTTAAVNALRRRRGEFEPSVGICDVEAERVRRACPDTDPTSSAPRCREGGRGRREPPQDRLCRAVSRELAQRSQSAGALVGMEIGYPRLIKPGEEQ